MLEQRIQQQFFEGADAKNQAAELLSRPISDAARALVAGFTAGGRLLVGARGRAVSLGHLVVAHLVGRFERERPGLAALALSAESTLTSTLAAEEGADALLARQLQTLGQPGDLLLLIDADAQPNESAAVLCSAARAAHAKEMTVIALTGAHSAGLAEELTETDVLIAVPHDRRARILELQLAALHCLCDAVDLQLLGEQEPA